MLQNATKCSAFRWSDRRLLAVQLVFEGAWTHAEIAAQVGVTRMTLYRWRQHPDFAARVETLLEQYRRQLLLELLKRARGKRERA